MMIVVKGVDFDDLVYSSLLFLSISFGWCFRRIKNAQKKKWISSIVGFCLVLAVSGSHVFRPLVVTTVNAFLITFCSKKYCHILSFFFTFGTLTFFRVSDLFGVPYAPGPVNLLNMVLTMRMIGLAFESRDSWLAHKIESKMATSGASLSEMEEKEPMDVHPTFMDVFHYSFCYVGVLTGPYYRFNTYRDMINTPFCKFAPCWEATMDRFKILPVTIFLYALVNFFYPNKLALTDEFYNNHSVLYRIIFLSISFFAFRMRMYTGLMLSECVCTMAGMGAYPEWCKPRSGMGPSCRWQEVARLTFATMFVSALWHGAQPGYYLCILTVPLHLIVEDLYVQLFCNDFHGPKLRRFVNAMLWFMRFQGFSYMCITFHLLSVSASLRYWSSIYYFYHWVLLTLYIFALALQTRLKKRKRIAEPADYDAIRSAFCAVEPGSKRKEE